MMNKFIVTIVVLCATFIVSSHAQSVVVTRPDNYDNWYAGESGYIKWSGGSSYVSISYQYSGASYWTTITSSTYNSGSYYWSIPTYVNGYVYIRVCSTSGTGTCGTSYYTAYVYSYNSTIYISPAAWVVPTVFAICVIIGVISCWRSRRCCFANRSGVDVYVPVTAQPQTYVQPVQQVAYAQPVAYQAAPGGAYYPSQPVQQVYYAPQ